MERLKRCVTNSTYYYSPYYTGYSPYVYSSYSSLILSGCDLRGTIPHEVGRLELQKLDLSENELTGTIPDLGPHEKWPQLYACAPAVPMRDFFKKAH